MERWKSKKEVMVRSNGEKWQIGVDDVVVDVAQQKHNNNKYYILAFRYIYI